ncbi:MAG: hypothetical protein EOO06_05270 [Chitinophagaceae bacterium]|nr:MAG: hypothetical protein EOO06_05270 [Chitinophagaceae bacterium]
MPFNQIKVYNQLLELEHYNSFQRINSLKGIFHRDFIEKGQIHFRGRPVIPVHTNPTAFEVLFSHLTTEVTDKATKARTFEMKRAKRLHWVRHHIYETVPDKISVFSVEDREGIRTYIFDQDEQYVIILKPETLSLASNHSQVYYLLTAYFLEQRNIEKVKKKFKRRLLEIY